MHLNNSFPKEKVQDVLRHADLRHVCIIPLYIYPRHTFLILRLPQAIYAAQSYFQVHLLNTPHSHLPILPYVYQTNHFIPQRCIYEHRP